MNNPEGLTVFVPMNIVRALEYLKNKPYTEETIIWDLNDYAESLIHCFMCTDSDGIKIGEKAWSILDEEESKEESK